MRVRRLPQNQGLTLGVGGAPASRRLCDVLSTGLGYDRGVTEEHAQPLEAQLEEIGSRLAWVRDYL